MTELHGPVIPTETIYPKKIDGTKLLQKAFYTSFKPCRPFVDFSAGVLCPVSPKPIALVVLGPACFVASLVVTPVTFFSSLSREVSERKKFNNENERYKQQFRPFKGTRISFG